MIAATTAATAASSSVAAVTAAMPSSPPASSESSRRARRLLRRATSAAPALEDGGAQLVFELRDRERDHLVAGAQPRDAARDDDLLAAEDAHEHRFVRQVQVGDGLLAGGVVRRQVDLDQVHLAAPQ